MQPAKELPPAPTNAQSSWIREVIDFGRGDGRLALRMTASPTLLTSFVGFSHVALRRTARGWETSTPHDVPSAGRPRFDATGAPWLAFHDDDAGELKIVAPGGKVETIANLRGLTRLVSGDVLDLAFDATGTPHVCFLDGKSLVHASREGGRWQTSKHPLPSTQMCAIAVEADGAVVMAHAGTPGAGLYVRRGATWSHEVLAQRSREAISVRVGANRRAVVAFIDGTAVKLARSTGTEWISSELVPAGDQPDLPAIALDRDDRAHVAFQVYHGGVDANIMYVREGSTAVPISSDYTHDLVIEIDATGATHVAYFGKGTDHGDELVLARARVASDSSGDDYRFDGTAMIAGCAHEIGMIVGRGPAPDLAGTERAERQCAGFAKRPLAIAELAKRCRDDEAAACVLGAATADTSSQVIGMFEITSCKTGSAKGCQTTYSENSAGLPGILPSANDDVLARDLLARGCELGSDVACLWLATVDSRENKPTNFRRACSAELPIACALAIDRLAPDAPDYAAAIVEIRVHLDKACAATTPAWSVQRFETPLVASACSSLAYLEETATKPNRTVAARHHLRACRHGSTASCTRLLTGALPRPPAPKGLEAEMFRERMSTRCERKVEDSCLGLATALEVGWVVKKDRDAARQLLEERCDAHMPRVCKRINKPVPR